MAYIVCIPLGVTDSKWYATRSGTLSGMQQGSNIVVKDGSRMEKGGGGYIGGIVAPG